MPHKLAQALALRITGRGDGAEQSSLGHSARAAERASVLAAGRAVPQQLEPARSKGGDSGRALLFFIGRHEVELNSTPYENEGYIVISASAF